MRHLFLALSHIKAHFFSYFSVVFLFHLPTLLFSLALAAPGYLGSDVVQYVSALVCVFLFPLSSGVIVWLFDRYDHGERPRLIDAFRAVAPRWKDLIVAYLSVGFIMIGWIALAMIPSGIIVLLLKLQSPLWFIPLGVAAMIYVLSRYVFLEFLIIYEKKEGWVARRAAPTLTEGRMLSLLVPVTLMSAPLTLSEFGYDKAANWLAMQVDLSAYLRHPELLFTNVLTLIATLLYLVPQRYFYQVYKELKR